MSMMKRTNKSCLGSDELTFWGKFSNQLRYIIAADAVKISGDYTAGSYGIRGYIFNNRPAVADVNIEFVLMRAITFKCALPLPMPHGIAPDTIAPFTRGRPHTPSGASEDYYGYVKNTKSGDIIDLWYCQPLAQKLFETTENAYIARESEKSMAIDEKYNQIAAEQQVKIARFFNSNQK